MSALEPWREANLKRLSEIRREILARQDRRIREKAYSDEERREASRRASEAHRKRKGAGK